MWVKICANTNAEDALEAAEVGASAVGFVFAPSKRQVNAEQVREITDQMPPRVERVGVFAGLDADGIAKTVREAGLTAVQLHGGLEPETVRRLRSDFGPALEIIHSVSWTIGDEETSEKAVREQLQKLQAGERVLMDAKVGGASGGLGVSFDWKRAGRVVQDFPELRVIIAGGLKPQTVAEAVRVIRPYGVDVASGVERFAGKKEPDKLRKFIENARRA